MADAPGGPLRDAIGALIDAGDGVPTDTSGRPLLIPLWPRWYRGEVTPQWDSAQQKDVWPAPGYFLLAQEDETEAGCYNQAPGQDVVQRIGCWGRTPEDAQRLHQWLKRQLHGVVVTPDGYQSEALRFMHKVGPLSDPTGTAFQQAADYAAEMNEATGA